MTAFIDTLDKKIVSKIDKWATQDNARPEILKQVFGDKERIVVPFKEKPSKANPKIRAFLKTHEYTILDYRAGLCIKGKQQISIGKVLNRFNADESLIKLYANDPRRAASKTASKNIVFSINKYDVACMSTNRGWSSCMNLTNGCNKSYIKEDLRYGTIVAYLVEANDVDVQKPLARIAIKQFINSKDKDKISYRPERIYGTAPELFLKQVRIWCEKSFKLEHNVEYCINNKLYTDTVSSHFSPNSKIIELPYDDLCYLVRYNNTLFKRVKRMDDDLIIKFIQWNAEIIQSFSVLSEKVQMAAIKRHPYCFASIKNPTDTVVRYAIINSPWLISKIKNPSDELKHLVLDREPSQFQHIKNPTKDMIEKAVKAVPRNIQHVKNQWEELKMLAIEQELKMLAIEQLAIEQYMNIYSYIKNPSEKIKQIAALAGIHQAMADLIKPSDEFLIELFEKHYAAMIWVRNPSFDACVAYLKKWMNIYPAAISNIQNPNDDLQRHICDNYRDHMHMIRNANENTQYTILGRDVALMKHVPIVTYNVQDYMMRMDRKNIQYISNPSSRIQMRAIDSNWKNIQYIHAPENAVQMAAVHANVEAYALIKFKCDDVKKLYRKLTRKPAKKKLKSSNENGDIQLIAA